MKVADANTVRSMDAKAVSEYGISGLQLMENAGRGVADAVKREVLDSGIAGGIAIFAGKGNNGGDGYCAARHLVNSGFAVTVYSVCKARELKGDAGANAASWTKMGGAVKEVLSINDLKACHADIVESSIIVDSIFGTGLSAHVAGFHAEVIEYINSLGKKTVAVDIPSGIDATTGAVLGHAIKASLTATMAMPKLGLVVYPGREYSGRVEVIDIGVPRALAEDPAIRWNLITDKDIKRVLRPRKPVSHKSAFGHLLVLAGSPGLTGAACMAGWAAMRAGAGLCTIGVPQSLNNIMEAKTTEVMSAPLPETPERTLGACSYERVKGLLNGKTALVIGPGAGTSDEVMRLIELILKDTQLPIVIDADGLNSFVPKISTLRQAKAKVVLTPHPGEMARLLDTGIPEVQADRIGAARKLVDITGAVVILKGAGTIIAAPSGELYINSTGNAGLATAGTGDILAGMLGGLLAQGYGPVEASRAAVYLHGLAGDEVKKERGELGMMATDLLECLPGLLNSFVSASV